MDRRRVAGRWDLPRFLQLSTSVKVRFGEFTLDSEARRLVRGDAGEIHLSPKAFDLLRLLIERRPNVLDKSFLHAEIWPSTFVVDANLSVLVAELRRALADDAREPRFIRTIHAVGYAFCAEATDVGSASDTPNATGARCWVMWNERAIVLRDGPNLIGRDPDCEVWIDASGVSRRHARIDLVRGGDGMRVEDLGSKNGTFLDGSPIRGTVAVSNGSVIRVGVVELIVRIWSHGQSRETERIGRTAGDPPRGD
jgi:DNA-binding winged helix-turn-helix (wHTH) protein